MQLSSAKIMREMLFVPPSMPALDLLEKMQATRIHLALVVDEYGGTDGSFRWRTSSSRSSATSPTSMTRTNCPPWSVSSTDRSSPMLARVLDDVTAGGRRRIRRRRCGREVDTLGGYLMTQVGRLPLRGEAVPGPSRIRDRGAGFRSAPDQEGAHPPQQGSPDRARPRRPPPL
jgi:hypothetical protein